LVFVEYDPDIVFLHPKTDVSPGSHHDACSLQEIPSDASPSRIKADGGSMSGSDTTSMASFCSAATMDSLTGDSGGVMGKSLDEMLE